MYASLYVWCYIIATPRLTPCKTRKEIQTQITENKYARPIYNSTQHLTAYEQMQ